MGLILTINGQMREFEELMAGVSLVEVIAAMNLKGDRVAVEHNGEIAQRARWSEVSVAPGDRLEVVHFVGGGNGIRRIEVLGDSVGKSADVIKG